MSKIYMPDDKKMPATNGKNIAWLAIQSSDHGDEDREDWDLLMPEDVPNWVTENDVVSSMMEGKMVCADPEKNTKWYRAVKCEAPRSH